MLLSRLPATPADPAQDTSNFAPGQNAPAQGSPRNGGGLVLANTMSVMVSVYPWTGATLSGGGNMLCWLWNPFMLRWGRFPAGDIALSATSGFPAVSASFTFANRNGWIVNWLSSSVTVSAGTDVLMRADGFTAVNGNAA